MLALQQTNWIYNNNENQNNIEIIQKRKAETFNLKRNKLNKKNNNNNIPLMNYRHCQYFQNWMIKIWMNFLDL
uniref:Uncharacterized protein n=1 Tax=Meloidogyne enterolobii TaxID=390850 RepID=A0A6V7UVE9_MELEN|nr:unnamed protein product [Meloidogyne enterolobii]